MKYLLFLIVVPYILILSYGGCGSGGDSVNTNRCFSVDSANPCFDENTGGGRAIVDDRSVNEVVDEKRAEQGFLGDMDRSHVIKSFNQTTRDLDCNEELSESEFVIKNSQDWDRFRNSCYFSQFRINPSIDFSTKDILVSIQDIFNGGTGTEILSVLEFDSKIVAIIRDDETAEPENFLRFIFHIVSIPKIDDIPVDFIRVKDSEVNICFNSQSDKPCFNEDRERTIITDQSIEQVIAEMRERQDFIGDLEIELNNEYKPFAGPPESFLSPGCVSAWGDTEGVIDNQEDWDNFRLNCLHFESTRLYRFDNIDFGDDAVVFSSQNTNGLGTTIDAVLEFNNEVEILIRDDISGSQLPIAVFPSNVLKIENINKPINFTRVENPSGFKTINGCRGEQSFSVVPACIAEDIASGNSFSDCDCIGETTGSFVMEFTFISNGSASPIIFFDREFSTSFTVEAEGCDTLSLFNYNSPNLGSFDALSVPDLGMLNFTKIIGDDIENVECDCVVSPCTFF